ncbi:MAG: hypothetical protein Q8921_10805, partial [Bacteroidota bacterium]|nr:hypothetical protein [Bacteroidota bacterium]
MYRYYFLGARLAVCLIALSFSTTAFSQDIPHTLSYQGVLQGADSKIVADGQYTITVHLYSDANGDREVWKETLPTTLSNGIFNIALGSTIPLPPMDRPLWAGTQIGNGEVMKPLTPLSATPYALGIADNSVTKGKMATDYVSSLTLNGQTVSGRGADINIQTGDGIVAAVDPATNTLLLKSGPTSLEGAKGGAVQGNTTISGSLTVTGSSYLGSSSAPTTIYGDEHLSGSLIMASGKTLTIPDLASSSVVRTDGSSNLTTGKVGVSDLSATGSASSTTFLRGDNTWAAPGGNGWNLTGNSGTTYRTNFIGTTDGQNLQIRVNNQQAGLIEYNGNTNTGIGYQVLNSNTTGFSNTASGFQSLFRNTTGIQNTASGTYALFSNTTGISNTASGAAALLENTTGSNNTAIGGAALEINTTGGDNTATGFQALAYNTAGGNNTASGSYALFSNSSGGSNTASGYGALESNTTGGYNTSSGANTLANNTTGTYNTASGASALRGNTTGSNNTASGHQALYSNTTGTYNTASGDQALYSNTTGNFNMASGSGTLANNTTGNFNMASGSGALANNTTGTYNMA